METIAFFSQTLANELMDQGFKLRNETDCHKRNCFIFASTEKLNRYMMEKEIQRRKLMKEAEEGDTDDGRKDNNDGN